MLRVAGSFGAIASGEVFFFENVQQVAGFQFECLVGLAFFVNQKRKGDTGFFPERASVGPVTEADCCEIRSAVAEFLFVGAQLRDVFAAKDSTVVAQKDDNRGLAKPQ